MDNRTRSVAASLHVTKINRDAVSVARTCWCRPDGHDNSWQSTLKMHREVGLTSIQIKHFHYKRFLKHLNGNISHFIQLQSWNANKNESLSLLAWLMGVSVQWRASDPRTTHSPNRRPVGFTTLKLGFLGKLWTKARGRVMLTWWCVATPCGKVTPLTPPTRPRGL